MKKLYRSALFAGVLAMGVAACGDDVTIIEPEPTPPPPLQVSMSPSNQAINVGETAVFAVSVSGGAEGAQASWTCASSATGVATVATSAAGCTVTGVAAGNASVTATVTKGNQTANAGGQVSVTAPPVATPATISIASVTQNNITADLENIQGQVDVTLNVDPKDETIQRVILFVDGVEVASQVFAAPVAGVEADAAAEAMQQVQLSFRSDFYSLNTTTGMGVPRHLNGDRIISAALVVAESQAPRPSNTVPVRFTNVDGFHVTTNLTSNASAMDGSGLVWYGGPDFSTDITAYPVLYSGRTFQSMNLGFCGSSTALTAGPFTITRTCAGVEATGLLPSITSVVSGEAGPGTANILNGTARFGLTAHPFPVRIDRVAPQGGAIVVAQIATLGNRANWVNGAYTFSNGYTAPADAGVGLPSPAGSERTFQVRQGTTVIATNVTNAAGLDNSITNGQYNVQAVVRDRLNNSRTISQTAGAAPNPLATFGVDKNAPQIQWDTMAATAFRADTTTIDEVATAAEYEFYVQAMDNVSGFALNTETGLLALEHTFTKVTGNYLQNPTMLDVDAIVGSGTISSTPFATAAAGTFIAATRGQVNTYAHSPTMITNVLDMNAVEDGAGYYIYQIRARDQAGNTSPVLSRMVYVNDAETPSIVQGLQTAISLPWQGGQNVVFEAVADDAVEIVSKSFGLVYEEVFAGVDIGLWNAVGPVASDGIKFNDVITRPQFLTFNTGPLIRSLTGTDAGLPLAPVEPSIAVAAVHSGFPSIVRPWDGIGDNGTVLTTAAIAAGQVAGPTTNPWTSLGFFETGFTIEISTVAGTNPDARTVSGIVNARGDASTFTNPFDAVAIVEQVGGNVRIVGLATLTPADGFPFLDDGIRRDFRWTFSVSGIQDGSFLHAVGLRGNDGLVSEGDEVLP
jgi:hypothetical protein